MKLLRYGPPGCEKPGMLDANGRTGTPPGVGMGVKPAPVFLKPGQTVRLGIQGLGEQHQQTRAAG